MTKTTLLLSLFSLLTLPLFAQLNGTYTIGGTSPDYTTIAEAQTALYTVGVNGPVIFQIRPGTYAEPFDFDGQISGASAANTITFQSSDGSAASVLIDYSDQEVLSLFDVAYLQFQDLRLHSAYDQVAYLYNATQISFTRVLFTGDANDTSNGIYTESDFTGLQLTEVTITDTYDYALYGYAYEGVSDVSISGCTFNAGAGINLEGVNAPSIQNTSITVGESYAYAINLYECPDASISGNTFELSAEGSTGIYMYYSSGTNVSENQFNITGAYVYGVQVDGENGNTLVADNELTVTADDVSAITVYSGNVNVRNNEISYSGSTGGQAIYVSAYNGPVNVVANHIYGLSDGYGIYISSLYGSSGQSGLVANNFIQVGGSSSYYGLYYSDAYYLDIVHNSINYTGSGGAALYSSNSYGSNARIVNNILAAPGGAYPLEIDGDGGDLTFCDYNNLYANGGTVVYYNYTAYADLAAWQAVSFFGQSSVSVAPMFVSATDLHVSQIALNAAAIGGEGVSTDFDGEARSTSPDIGADEFTAAGLDAAINLAGPSLPLAPYAQDVQINLANAAQEELTSATITWSINGVAQPGVNWTGSLPANSAEVITLGNYTFEAGQSYDITISLTDVNGGAAQLSTENDMIVLMGIPTAMAGPYTVGGVDPDFSTIALAIDALYDLGVADAVTFLLRPGTYNEEVYISGEIPGADESHTVTFSSESLDASTVTIENDYAPIYLEEVSYIYFSHLTIRTNGSYAYVLESYSAGHLGFDQCDLLGQLGNSYDLLYLSNFAGHFSLTNCTLENGYQAVTIYPAGTAAGVILRENTISDVAVGLYASGNLESPTIEDNTFSMSGGYNGIELYQPRGQLRISGNRIHHTPNGSGAGIYISNLQGSGASGRIVNNFITVGGGDGIHGIYAYQADRLSILHNNIMLTASGSNSFALQMEYGSNGQVLNNILAASGQGLALADRYGAHQYDYNDLVAVGAALADQNYNTYADLAAWQGATGFDIHSISVDPLFVSATDLHVQATALDGAGLAGTGVGSDIDGEARDAATPDIGADEFERLAEDVALTTVLAPLMPIAASEQEVVVELQNLGVNTLTSLTLEWSVNAVPQTAVNWSGSLAGGAQLALSLGNYDFSSGGTFLLEVTALNPNNVADQKPENNSLQATLETALIGTYTVSNSGGSPDFASIAEAVEALNNRGAAGDVVFALAAGVYNEQISIGDFLGNDLYQLTIRSQATDVEAVRWEYGPNYSENYVLQLAGIRQFQLEGIHLRALNASSYGTVIELIEGTDISFSNNHFEGLPASSAQYSKAIIRHSGNLVNRLQLSGNEFTNGGYGLYFSNGFGSYGPLLSVTGNTFQNQYTAVQINYMDRMEITDNAFSASHIGSFIAARLNGGEEAVISGNTANGTGLGEAFNVSGFSGSVSIRSNKIAGAGAGVSIAQLSGSTQVVNNFIQVGDRNANAYAIQGSSNNNVRIVHNSLLNLSSGSSINNVGLVVYGSGSYEIQNNIIAMTGGGIVLNLSSSASYTSDYNDLYDSGNTWGIWANNFRSDLADWQSVSGLDANSISVFPQFVSNVDLHVSQAELKAAGTAAGVGTDIDGEPRDPLTPDIGADEFPFTTVDILPTALVSATTLCPDTDVWLEVAIKNEGASPATGFDIQLLDGATVLIEEGVGDFTVPSGETVTYTFQNPINLSNPGDHPLQVLTVLTGDGDVDNNSLAIILQVQTPPTATAANNGPLCAGELLQLSASGGVTYEWAGPNDFTGSEAVLNINEAQASQSGLYQVTVTDVNGCKATAETTVEIHDLPVVSAASNGPLCEGSTLQLTGSGGVSYAWEGPAGFSSDEQNPIRTEVTAAMQGSYSLTVTDANNCQATATTDLTINTVAGSISQNGPLCVGEQLQLQASGGSTYEWEGPAGFTSTVADPVIAGVEVSMAGLYSVTITAANGCEQVLETTVVVNELPNAQVSPNETTICGGIPTTLTASGGVSYLWSTGATTAEIEVSPVVTTDYSVVVTNAAGCTAEAQATIQVENSAPYFALTGSADLSGSAVSPLQGSPYQNFHFEIDYFDADGDLPAASFPRLLLDYNNNGSYADASDRIFVMTEADPTDTDVTDGKRYFYEVTGLPNSMQYRTSFLAQDTEGCEQQPFTPLDEPNVVDFADISIYANDIQFSNDQPDPGTPLDVSATIHNNSDFSADNFVVRLINQYSNEIYPDLTVTQLPPHSTTTVSWTITTPAEVSWNPMQVIIDYTDQIDEPNELDNQAIRPFINGDYNLPGTILLSSVVSPEVSVSGSSNITVSGNAVYDGTAVPLSDPSVAGATVQFTVLETGQTFSTYTNSEGRFSYSFKPPLTPGLYHLSGTVTDFTLTGTFTDEFVIQPGPCKPDLTCEFTLSTGAVQVGGQATGSIRIRNNGCATSGLSTLLDVSGRLGSPIPADAVVPALAPGESFVYEFPNPVTFNTIGTAYIQAITDASLIVLESNEQNNTCSASVRVNPDLPDIRIGYIANGGQRYQCADNGFTVRLDNVGGIGTGAFQVERRIRRLADDVIEYSDVVDIDNIPAGRYVYSSFNHQFAQTGAYTIEILADIPTDPLTGVVAELNETNNTGSVGVQVINCLPDLRLEGGVAVAPTDAHAASEITLTARITNSGLAPIVEDIPVSFTIGAQTVQVIHSGGLAVGQIVPVMATMTSPGTDCAEVLIHVDPTNQITEVSEANNTQLHPLTYDFYLGNYCSFTAPKFWQKVQKVNQPVNFQVGLYNTGYFTASAVSIRFEISGPGISGWLDWGSTSINQVGKTFSCPYVVAANTEYVFTQTGTYAVRMTVDAGDAYVECNEANNVMIVNVSVAEDRPDLRILSQYIAPSKLNPDVGEAVNFAISYENIGKSNIGDDFKMSWSVNEVLQDEVDAIGLNTQDTWTLAMPSSWSSTIPGIHIVRATIDSDDEIEENDESNNSATRAILVGQYPNLYFDQIAVSEPDPALNEQIDLNFTIANEGDLDCDATVQLFYVNDFQDTVLFETFPILIAANDYEDFTRTWVVQDPATTLILRIVNADPEEFNTTDNQGEIQLGQLSVSATMTQAASCADSEDAQASVTVSGGRAPYLIQWSNNTIGESITAGAGTYQVSVTDQDGNTATASVALTAEPDTEQPLIFNGPGDIVLTITDGICPVPVNWTAPEVIDNCSLQEFSSNYEPGASFPAGTTTVTYTARDLAGNSRTYSFDIIINAQPIALAGEDQLICGPLAQLSATTPGLGTGQWTVLEGGAVFADVNDPQTMVSELAPGTNRLQWQVTNGSCGSATDEITIIADPGALPFGGDNFAPPVPGMPGTTIEANWEVTDASGWTHYYRCGEDGSTGHLLLSLYKDGQDIGTIGNGLAVRNVTVAGYGGGSAHNLSGADYVETDNWFVFGRYWDVSTSTELVAPMRVRYYYTDEDVAALRSSIEANEGLWNGDEAMRFFKVSGAGVNPFDTDVLAAGGTYHEYENGGAPSLENWIKGSYSGVTYAEYMVSSFSGGGGGGSPSPAGLLGALPLDLISFSAERVDQHEALIQWTTANEEQVDGFYIQRTTDGIQWERIGFLPSQGDQVEEQYYQFTDVEAPATLAYYRLEMHDLDGTITYSPLRSISAVSTAEALKLYPNPTSGILHLELRHPALVGKLLEYRLLDGLGREVFAGQVVTEGSMWNAQIDALQDFPAGVYTLLLSVGNEWRSVRRVVKD